MERITRPHPFIWGGIIYALCQVLTFLLASVVQKFLSESNITPPEASVNFALIYFFTAVVLIGIGLFFIPVSKLKFIAKLLFALMLAWGVFVVLGFFLPLPASIAIAVVAGSVWYLKPVVWLHNLLLALALVSLGAIFGFFFAPTTFLIFMLAISIYDILAVSLGYMMWMVKRLSEFDTLPAFVIPRTPSGWTMDLRQAGIKDIAETKPPEREFAVLGGGDIGFPLLLVISVFSGYNLSAAIVVAIFALAGLIGAFLIQMFLLKGKPVPALPPIFVSGLIGFLIARFFFP